MKNMKNVVAILLVVAMFVGGIAFASNDAKAESTKNIPTTIDMDDSYAMADYWSAETKTAPTKDGYVFGGWFEKEGNEYKAIKEEDIIANGVDAYDNAYAKFVPAYVLSVRMQLEKDTQDNNGKDIASTYLRVISAVDSLNYKNVGFDILFNKKTALGEEANKATVLTKVYKNIVNGDGEINATAVFGEPATHFSILKIDKIAAKNFEKVIYVTPYWTTMDGTKVEGLSKYVRVMDAYADNRYISIPVNLSEGSDVAAGKLQMTYDQTKLQYVGFDSGVILPEMEVKANESAGRINFVGNGTDTAKEVNPTSGIYANVWFKKTTSDTGRFEFDVKNLEFCTWEPKMVDNVNAWDIQY